MSDKLKLLGSKKIFISAGNKSAYYSDDKNSKKYTPPKVKVSNVSEVSEVSKMPIVSKVSKMSEVSEVFQVSDFF